MILNETGAHSSKMHGFLERLLTIIGKHGVSKFDVFFLDYRMTVPDTVPRRMLLLGVFKFVYNQSGCLFVCHVC